MIEGWRYYNHALLPITAPFKPIDDQIFSKKGFWSVRNGIAVMAQYISDYDCQEETQWWCCVKDTPYNFERIKAKRRYVINKGRKNFRVANIDVRDYLDELIDVEIKALENYPEEYRPDTDIKTIKEKFKDVEKSKLMVMGAFNSEKKLCGYLTVHEYDDYCNFAQQKVIPEYEKQEINAALVDGMLQYYNNRIKDGYVIYDGQRNLIHQTNFQEYLVKYFEFRYAYCRLRIQYRFPLGLAIKILYPFKGKMENTKNRFLYKVGGVLRMEEIRRKCME